MEKDLSMWAAVYGTIADKEKYIFGAHSGYFLLHSAVLLNQ